MRLGNAALLGVYANLVDGGIWDAEAVGSSPATPTKSVNMDLRFKLPPTDMNDALPQGQRYI